MQATWNLVINTMEPSNSDSPLNMDRAVFCDSLISRCLLFMHKKRCYHNYQPSIKLIEDNHDHFTLSWYLSLSKELHHGFAGLNAAEFYTLTQLQCFLWILLERVDEALELLLFLKERTYLAHDGCFHKEALNTESQA